MFEVDCVCSVGQNFSQLYIALYEVNTIFYIHDRIFRYSLWEGRIDRFAEAQPGLVDIIDDFLRAFFPADAAACAGIRVNIAGFLANGHGEVAYIAIHIFDFTPGEQVMFGCEPA